ncbi:MAG: F0F1 ATP synthase subunit B [Planctomycetota bacterium]
MKRLMLLTLVAGLAAMAPRPAFADETVGDAPPAEPAISSDEDAAEDHAEHDHDQGHDHVHDHSDDDHDEVGGHSGGAHSEGAHTGEGHASDASGGGVNPIAVDVDLAFFTLIVFVALAALLRLVAWDPIMKALEAREEGIAGNIRAAEAKHDEAKALYDEHAAKVAAATDEVKAMLDEARRDAEATKAAIVDEARSAAAAEKQRAIREVEQARDSAIKHLAEESANLAIDLAAKVVRQDITQERQGEIIREAIGRLGSADPSSN